MGKQTEQVAVVGAGLIGSGWAAAFAAAGLNVRIYDTDDARLAAATETVAANMQSLVRLEIVTAAAAARNLSRVTVTVELADAIADCTLVQESISENLADKQRLFAKLDELARPDTILASSTSGFRITDVAADCRDATRCIGAHPYNPPHLVPLVELSKGDRTDDAVVQRAKSFYSALGKEPIVLNKEALGFIANRLQMALYREAVDLVSRGVCTVEDVDKACVFGPGIRWATMGPNLVFHLGSGPAGIRAGLERYLPAFELWLGDMATWQKFPEAWPEVAQRGVEQQLARRSASEGTDYASLTAYRDEMLAAQLRLHGTARRGT